MNANRVSLSEMQDMRSSRTRSMGRRLLFFGIILLTGGGLSLVDRKVYKTTATVEAGFLRGDSSFDPEFNLKQFAGIRSDAVLTNVVATLNLNNSWGEKYNHGRPLSDAESEKRIWRRLKLQFVQNTRFLNIRRLQ